MAALTLTLVAFLCLTTMCLLVSSYPSVGAQGTSMCTSEEPGQADIEAGQVFHAIGSRKGISQAYYASVQEVQHRSKRSSSAQLGHGDNHCGRYSPKRCGAICGSQGYPYFWCIQGKCVCFRKHKSRA